MKKIISITLAVIMVALACPLSVFAAVSSSAASGDQITTGVVSIVQIENNEETTYGTYDTMDAAFEALGDIYKPLLADTSIVDGNDTDTNLSNELYAAAKNPVIKLNGNFQGAYAAPSWVSPVADNAETTDVNEYDLKFYDPNKVVTIVIDGAKSATENYTITYGAVTAFEYMAYYNLTIKNTNMVFNRGASKADNNFQWYGRPTAAGESFTVFENCVIDQNADLAGSGEGGLFKLNGFKKAAEGVDSVTSDIFNVTFKDCTINHATAVGLQVHWGVDANINLINTTWTADGGAGKANNNDCILKAYESGDVKFSIDGTSKLISARSEGAITTTLIRTTSTLGGDLVVDLAQGAELIMNNTATESLTTQTYISTPVTAGHTVTVTDNGAIFKANADSQKLGVTLPTFYGSDSLPHIWKLNGVGDAIANPYKDEAATADATFTHSMDNDPENNPNNVAYIQYANGTRTYFTSLQYAVNALESVYAAVTTANLTDDALWEAAGSPVIVIYKDIELTSTVSPSWWNQNYNANRVRTVYIKGVKADNSKVKITSNVEGAAFQSMSYYNFTLENIDLECTKGFALFWAGYWGGKNSGKSTTNLINCNIKATGTTGEGLVFKVTGNQTTGSKTENYIINMVKTTVTATAGATVTSSETDSDGVNAVFLFHHGCAGTLNIDGESVIKHYNKRATSGGDTIFMLGTNRYFDINVASGAVIEGTPTRTSAGTYSIFRTEASNTYPATGGKAKNTINIASGATIALKANNAFTKPLAFIWQLTPANQGGAVINIASGANLITNAKTGELGFDVIKGTYTSDSNLLGWNVTNADNETTLYSDDTFAAGKVGEVTITPVAISNTALTMVENAGLKLGDQGTTGLAFRMNVSKDLIDLIGDGEVTYGMLIAPQEWTVFGFDKTKLSQGQCLDLTVDGTALKGEGDDKTCTIGFSGYPIGDAALLPISARGYVTFKIGTETFTVYASNAYTTSVYDLAVRLSNDGYADNATVQQILAVAEA